MAVPRRHPSVLKVPMALQVPHRVLRAPMAVLQEVAVAEAAQVVGVQAAVAAPSIIARLVLQWPDL